MPSTYRIVCVNRQPAYGGTHRHIVSVGIADYRGWKRHGTVDEVRAAIIRGDQFYTQSPSTGVNALVEPWNCCGVRTLRSTPDRVTDNNLDNLRACF